jgi:hypothetical protein
VWLAFSWVNSSPKKCRLSFGIDIQSSLTTSSGEKNMASSNRNITGVDISLIVFVSLTLILAVLSYLGFSDLGDAQSDLDKAKSELAVKNTAVRNLDDEVQALKRLIGHLDENVGALEQGKDTVLAKMKADLELVAQVGATQENYSVALNDLRNRLETKIEEANKNQQIINDEQAERARQKSEFENQLKVAQDAQKAAETHRDEVESSLKEIVEQRDVELRDGKKKYQILQADYLQDKDTWTNEKNQLDYDITLLTSANERLWEEVDRITKVSFEKPDGLINTVEHSSGLVWINLGSEDRLPKRLTFSVYNRAHHGVGRGLNDLKGAIEVTRVLGPHLAQARILGGNSFNPITQSDPIYTPLWSPGRIESFAFVGMMDFDNDGLSDRARMREFVAVSGARITTEVDDEGNRTGKPIGVETKYLVVGELPDPAEEADAQKRANQFQVLGHFRDMEKEARIQGVRKINLSDFLSHIGYKPKRRFWAPGMQIPWKLKGGAQSTSVNQTLGNRASSGQVSGVYGKKQLTPKTSSGQTSKIFRGARGGN